MQNVFPFVKYEATFKPISANVPILYPQKTFGFLVFLGGIKWEH